MCRLILVVGISVLLVLVRWIMFVGTWNGVSMIPMIVGGPLVCVYFKKRERERERVTG